MPFCAPSGYLLVEADYSGQELRIGAVLSKDETMVEAFTAPDKLLTEDGREYDNPYADLHAMSGITCIDPDWFIGIPVEDWVKRSRECRPGQTKDPRSNGKTLNFASIYLSTAKSIAERNCISLETAKEWESRHRKSYKTYYDWAAEVGRIAVARGYAINTEGRIRWVDEANSKGSGESTERNAVNFLVQGMAADMTKEADIRLREAFRGTGIKGLLAVHDALLFKIPGTYEILWDESEQKNGVWTKLKYKINKEAEEIGNKIIAIMEEVETEMFSYLGSPIKGKADIGIKPFWSH